jgi:hypothetical protein
MAVAECPNCHHDIQTPPFRFRKSGWKNFQCLYCRAKLQRKRHKWADAVLSAITVMVTIGLPAKILSRANLIVLLIPTFLALFNLSRPKLAVISAPMDPVREMNLRHQERQSAVFSRPAEQNDALTELRINPRRDF